MGFFSSPRNEKHTAARRIKGAWGKIDTRLTYRSTAGTSQGGTQDSIDETPTPSHHHHGGKHSPGISAVEHPGPLEHSASERRMAQHESPSLPLQGPRCDDTEQFSGQNLSQTNTPGTLTSYTDREPRWVRNNPQSPFKTDVELPSDSIPANNGMNARAYQSPPAGSLITPRGPSKSAITPSTISGRSSRLAGHASNSSAPDSLVAAQVAAMRASSQVAPPRPMAPVWPPGTGYATAGQSTRYDSDGPHQRLSKNGTQVRAANPPPAPASNLRESGTRDVNNWHESTETQQPKDAHNRSSGTQDDGTLELENESGVIGAHHGLASLETASASPEPSGNEPQSAVPDEVPPEALVQQENGNEDDSTEASEQGQDENTTQSQTSADDPQPLNEESATSHESIVAALQQRYFNPTIPGFDEAPGTQTNESDDEGEIVAGGQPLGVVSSGSNEVAERQSHQSTEDDPDLKHQGTSDLEAGSVAAQKDITILSGELEEFLTAHKIPRKVGYGPITTILYWMSEMDKSKDTKLDHVARKSAEILKTIRQDAETARLIQGEKSRMEEVVNRLSQELTQATRDLDYFARDLAISDQKLREMEARESAGRGLLSECQIKLSAEMRESAVHKTQLEKVRRDLETGRQALQEAKGNLAAERTHSSNLSTRVEALERTLSAEKQERREEITRYSRYIESAEKDKKAWEATAARAEERLTTSEAANERQRGEHAEAIRTLQGQYATRTQALKDEHAGIIQGLQSQQEDYVRNLKGQHAEKTRTLQSQHKNQIQDLKREHAESVRIIQSQHTHEVQKIKREHLEYVQALQLQHNHKVQELSQENDRNVKELESQIAQILHDQTQRDQEIQRLKDQISQADKAHIEQISKLKAESARKVKTEVGNAIKEKQQRIDALEGVIIGSQDKYYVQISDTSFIQLLESISQQITDLSAGVGRPSAHLFDRSLDPTNYLERNPRERDRSWTVFIRSVCWNVLIPAFFESPLGFGCLGSVGEGYERLYELYLLFSRPTADGASLEFLGDQKTNIWRASFFDAFLKTVKANPSAMQQCEGQNTYSVMFKAHIDRVVRTLTDKLLRLSNRQLDARVSSQIFKVVYDTGILSLQMGSQRAHVMLELCESGELVRAGDRFTDEGGLTGIDTAVGLMTQPCMVRIGDGTIDTTSEHIIVRGRFISSRS